VKPTNRRTMTPADFEELGHQTMLETRDLERTKEICALQLYAYEDERQPELGSLRKEMEHATERQRALHHHLYARPIPVNDAAMLSRSQRIRLLLALAGLAAVASLVGNTTTFYLFGFSLLTVVVLALGTTALPVVVGHLVYEWIIVRHRLLQGVVILLAAALCCGALFRLAEARRMMVVRTASNTPGGSYVEETAADTPAGEAAPSEETSESKVRQTLSGGMLFLLFAADLMLGFLLGAITQMRGDEDYVAWQELGKLKGLRMSLGERMSEILSRFEVNKKRCLAGILHAQNLANNRQPPYHQILAALALFLLVAARPSHGQTIQRYEGILIDTSGSIQRGGGHNDLFREYLFATRKLLLTEPANSRVWVSAISTDSFGGTREILRGWTPDARGVFTDDLNRARRQLASSFEEKSSGMSPVAAGTDIFGGLWHLKALFEPGLNSGTSQAMPKTIWIFSDMVNETQNFPMPALIATGPERMLERVKANGQLVPLNGYKINVYGASPSGLTPQAWLAAKRFWTLYFSAAGAELVSYSAECEIER